ncbi:hypothetical protein ACIQ9E_08085 [Streptomyces sp. NPDC094448]|uniref:hypothetical protein n=1 Tax=Streptomyces sp. NPDC094448 TaxID=3366063 RepID=UPI00380A4576
MNFHDRDSIRNVHSDPVHDGMLTGACAVAARPAPPGPDPARADTVLERSGLPEDHYGRYGPATGTGPTARKGTDRR